MRNIGQMMKQAKEMQSRMAEVQAKLAGLEATGAAGGGLVEITLNGKGEMRRVRIDPSLASEGEREMLEDLVVAAHHEARAKVDALVQEEMQKVTGDLGLPGNISLPGLT